MTVVGDVTLLRSAIEDFQAITSGDESSLLHIVRQGEGRDSLKLVSYVHF
jgi:hypothetical protein